MKYLLLTPSYYAFSYFSDNNYSHNNYVHIIPVLEVFFIHVPFFAFSLSLPGYTSAFSTKSACRGALVQVHQKVCVPDVQNRLLDSVGEGEGGMF